MAFLRNFFKLKIKENNEAVYGGLTKMYFNETERLRKDSDFRRVYKHGKSFANRYLVMYIMRNNLEYNRVGISVSKKVGKAIVRNKVKRRIRESFRLDVDKKIKSGYDIVFIARVAISDMQYNEINKSMKHLVNKFKLFK